MRSSRSHRGAQCADAHRMRRAPQSFHPFRASVSAAEWCCPTPPALTSGVRRPQQCGPHARTAVRGRAPHPHPLFSSSLPLILPSPLFSHEAKASLHPIVEKKLRVCHSPRSTGLALSVCNQKSRPLRHESSSPAPVGPEDSPRPSGAVRTSSSAMGATLLKPPEGLRGRVVQ